MIIYLLGLLITITILLIWFYSPFRITIGQLFFDKEMYSFEQFENYILFFNPWLGKLLSCYICFSFWTSLAIGFIFIVIGYASFPFPIITSLTYPGLCYIYKKIIDK
jgi:hypothetical protein